MKKLLLLIALVIALAYAYHWFNGDGGFGGKAAATPEPVEATPVIRRTTPSPTPVFKSTGLQTHSLNESAHGTSTPAPMTHRP